MKWLPTESSISQDGRPRQRPPEARVAPTTRLRGPLRYVMWTIWGAAILISVGLLAAGVAMRFAEQSSAYGSVGRMQNSGDLGLTFEQTPGGAIILQPWPSEPAARAGILMGDLLTGIGDRRVADGYPLARLLGDVPLGTPMTLAVQTGSRPERRYTFMRGGAALRFLAPLHVSARLIPVYSLLVELVFALITLLIAGSIFVRRRDDWLASLASLMLIMGFLGTALADPVNRLAATHRDWQLALNYWGMLAMGVALLFLYVFPDGRFAPRWSLGLEITWIGWVAAALVVPSLAPWRLPPAGDLLVSLAWLASGILAQIYRYRWVSGSVQRQQTKWVVFGVTIMALGAALQFMHVMWDYPRAGYAVIVTPVTFDVVVYPVARVLELCLALSITMAILRHRLWDIDVIINRTLVYGALMSSVVGVYVGLVVGLGALFQATGNLAISLAATASVAVLFQPLRDRLQRGVNRLMYGERDTYRVMSRLGRRLGAAVTADAILPSIVETIAQALKLPYAAVLLKQGEGFEQVASYGPERTAAGARDRGAPLTLPLVYQTETVGQLVVAPRAPGESFNTADRRLLEEVAQLAGTAAHAVRLSADLQRSREQLVTAREEERRRLRRDLHDGLGPSLAGLTLQLDAARRLLARDPVTADALLVELKELTQAAIADIRRLVYELRPPALDDLGLVPALRQQASQLSQVDRLTISVEAPEWLPPLPAAVEVAVYRIALEALTNAVRYSHAGRCVLRLTLTDILQLEISDDGVGIPRERTAGVGLASMRERAAELGGSCTIDSNHGRGTRVVARLPYKP